MQRPLEIRFRQMEPSPAVEAKIREKAAALELMTPRRTAARVGSRPAAPTIADMTQSAERSAASIRPVGPPATSTLLPPRASLSDA
jgi:hypothetical protein